ncbi:DUF559 domain-containing protein [Amycolatopsis sp. NPDC026612]|uniref:DUF559 domain-containing protein n=1 Tax=Amycolatopsis sp. NPDC026612 TaxID=3155466 RepID=UPI0033CD75BD
MDPTFPARHGAQSRQQVSSTIGNRALRAALGNRSLVQPWRGVVVLGSRELDPLTRAAAGLLVVGSEAVLSHDTAAALHGCTVLTTTDVHVTVPYSHWAKSRKGLVVHHRHFAREDVVERHGLPVFELEAVIADVLCCPPSWRALACLDEALSGLGDPQARALVAKIDRQLADRADRRGTRIAESLLCLGSGKAESPQESRLRLLVIQAGFPAPVLQHEVLSLSGAVMYRLDLAWPSLRIALEYDGYEAHEDRTAEDADRDRRLTARGWIVIRARKDVFDSPGRVLSEIEGALRRRKVRRGA